VVMMQVYKCSCTKSDFDHSPEVFLYGTYHDPL